MRIRRRSTNTDQSPKVERFKVDCFNVCLTVRGHQFTFPLCGQVRILAPDRKIAYYWIDQRLLEENANNRSTNLCRRIVDHWEQVLFDEDTSGVHSPSEGLVPGHLFRALSSRKRIHQVFRDASPRSSQRLQVFQHCLLFWFRQLIGKRVTSAALAELLCVKIAATKD